jgi:hypothetical protein
LPLCLADSLPKLFFGGSYMFRIGCCLKGIVFAVFWLTFTAEFCCPEGLIQEVEDSGVVDWQKLVIRCTGVGAPTPEADPRRPSVIQSARSDALDKLLKTLRAVSLTSEATVGEIMDHDEALSSRVRESVKKFREVGTHYMSDGSVEIEVEHFLRGELMDLLLPVSGGGKRITDGLLCPICGQPWPEGREVPPDLRLVWETGWKPRETYTGLVIDARGLGLKPALAPQVLNERGKIVYSVAFAKRPSSKEVGIIAYERGLDRARDKERVGSNPLVIVGLRARGRNRTDVVIDDDHVAMLHSMPEHLQFMERCRVIVVLE